MHISCYTCLCTLYSYTYLDIFNDTGNVPYCTKVLLPLHSQEISTGVRILSRATVYVPNGSITLDIDTYRWPIDVLSHFNPPSNNRLLD